MLVSGAKSGKTASQYLALLVVRLDTCNRRVPFVLKMAVLLLRLVSRQQVEGSRSQTVESPAVNKPAKPQHFMTSPSLNEVLESARLKTKEAGWTKVVSKKEKKKLSK